MSLKLAWIGWMTVPVGDGRRSCLFTIDINVRRDIVLFYIRDRNIAVIDRWQFQRWLLHPEIQLAQDDVVFMSLAGELCLTIDASVPYVVPSYAARDLLRLV